MTNEERANLFFLQDVFADNPLKRAIAWIRIHMAPDEVFTETDLRAWAEKHGYVTNRRTGQENDGGREMKIRIDPTGHLWIERAGVMRKQYCPHDDTGDPTACGEWCPLFQVGDIGVAICERRLLAGVVEDMRVTLDKGMNK